MMGRQRGGQKQLFYSFNLDDHVPSDHLLRGIDQFLDLGGLHRHLAPYYSHPGRPSIDPQLLIRMLIVGYCFGIRSERQLCEEVHLNLAYRWFCRLGLEDPVPDHSTFSIFNVRSKVAFLPAFVKEGLNALLDEMKAQVRGLEMFHIRKQEVDRLLFPNRTVPEQRRIVAELEAIQSNVDALRDLQARTAAELDALLPAILDRAFRGAL